MIRRRFERHLEGDGHARVLRGDIRVPEGPPPRSAVVVVHGFKGFKDWAFFPWLADLLAADGHAVISFNFSGSGIGPESPSDFTDLEGFARNTLTREAEEIDRVVAEVRSRQILPFFPRTVGLLGHSRGGGGVVLHAARAADPPDALVTWAAVSDFDRWSAATREEWRRDGRIHVPNTRTGQHMPLDVTFLEDFEANRERFDVEAAAGRVACPWLIVHGMDDRTVDSAEARALARAGRRVRLHLVEGAGHTFEARHPLDSLPPELMEATEVTRRHFTRHLTPEREGGRAGGRP